MLILVGCITSYFMHDLFGWSHLIFLSRLSVLMISHLVPSISHLLLPWLPLTGKVMGWCWVGLWIKEATQCWNGKTYLQMFILIWSSTATMSMNNIHFFIICFFLLYGFQMLLTQFTNWYTHYVPSISLTCCKIKWPPLRKKSQPGRNLIKKTVKLALDDLKEKHAGMLLSAHALKVALFLMEYTLKVSMMGC